jgi:hypothetical protein
MPNRYALLSARAANRRKLSFEFLLAFLQSLKTKLPTVQLDAELVYVASDLGALRLVLFELMLEFGKFGRAFGGSFEGGVRYRGRVTTLLAIYRHAGRRGVDYK